MDEVNRSEADTEAAAIGILYGHDFSGRVRTGQNSLRRILTIASQTWAAQKSGPLVGSHVAMQSLYASALDFFSQPVRVYVPPSLQPAASLDNRQNHGDRGARVSFAPLDQIMSDWRSGQLTSWFEPGGNFVRGLTARAVSNARPIPVVSLNYGFSTSPMWNGFFLPILMAPTYPFDALVCTSTAARGAIQSIFDQIADDVRHMQGARHLDLKFNGRTPVIPLGVDTGRFKPYDKEVARSLFGFPLGKFVLLYFGRLSATDKADLLPWLNSLCRLPPSIRKQILVVVTGGSRPGMTSEIRQFQAATRGALSIRLVGGISELLKPKMYAAADVFVCPADCLMETFGLAPLEAMACGVPQVVSDWDGYSDIVLHGQTGFLVPTAWAPCDAEAREQAAIACEDWNWQTCNFQLAQSVACDCDAFASYITLLIENESLRRRLAEASRARAVNFYAWSVVARQYSELLGSLTSESECCAMAWPESADRCRYYAVPRFFEAFSHYASKTLDLTALLGPRSEEFSESQWADKLPYSPLHDLEPGLLRFIDEFVRERSGATIGMVLAAVAASRQSIGKDTALRHLMWLMKYDFISVPGDWPRRMPEKTSRADLRERSQVNWGGT